MLMRKALLNCSPVELIAMATGRRGAAAIADAHKLLERVGLKKLSDAGTAEIQAVCKGMTNDAVNRHERSHRSYFKFQQIMFCDHALRSLRSVM